MSTGLWTYIVDKRWGAGITTFEREIAVTVNSSFSHAHSPAQHNTARHYNTIQYAHSPERHNTSRHHNAIQYAHSTAQHNTARHCIIYLQIHCALCTVHCSCSNGDKKA